jgi:uncharacterized protein (TIGR02996 family)
MTFPDRLNERPARPEEAALLQGIVEHPGEEDRYLVLADWLEEQDDPRRGELLRLHQRLIATCCEPSSHPERPAWQARIVELLAEGVRPSVSRQNVLLGQRAKIPLTFAWIPPGTFLMGSPDSEEGRRDETLHRVTLSRGFWLGVCPVTQGQWRRVMGKNPSHFKGDARPVDSVPWEDCQAFCQKNNRGYRLPSEAEWEYACRAGTTTAYCSGDGLAALQQVGWCSYDGNWGSAKQTKPTGTFQPNAWGLYDIHGNVWEWCQDWYGPYPDNDITDPLGPSSGGSRVLRGGSWRFATDYCRAAYRNGDGPAFRGSDVGLRVCFRLD